MNEKREMAWKEIESTLIENLEKDIENKEIEPTLLKLLIKEQIQSLKNFDNYSRSLNNDLIEEYKTDVPTIWKTICTGVKLKDSGNSFTEKDIKRIFKTQICDYDIYNCAYENCDMFRMYINSLPEDSYKSIKKAIKANKSVDDFNAVRSLGLSRIGNKGRKRKIEEMTSSRNFSLVYATLLAQRVFG